MLISLNVTVAKTANAKKTHEAAAERMNGDLCECVSVCTCVVEAHMKMKKQKKKMASTQPHH